MTIYHKHHIIPKHMGGSDDPSNLIELTVEEHAEAHRKLHELHGHLYDKLAWLGLSGMIGKEEILKTILSENGKKSKGFSKEQQSKGGKTSSELYPEKPSIAGKALWSKPGMREHLSKKRIEQSKSGNNPMKGRKQRRVCCMCCKKEFAYNQFVVHMNKESASLFCF